MGEVQIITENLTSFYMIGGMVLLSFDIIVIGMSPIMFFAIGAIGTSLIFMVTGWHPTLAASLALWSAVSIIVATTGWSPLKRFQHAGVQEDESSDLIGKEMITTSEVTPVNGEIHWQGTLWRARAAEVIPPNTPVTIVKMDGNVLILKPVS